MIGYRENYDQIARDHIAHWRETGNNPWQYPEHVEAVNEATAELVRAYSKPGDPILDAGCGMAEVLSRLPNYPYRYGCDFAIDYLPIARSRGIDARYGELEALPYAKDRFEVVIATDVLEHVLDLNAVVRELLRVLRPDGTLIVRSPDGEDLTPYLAPDYPYRYVHLRRFDEPSLRLLFDRVFGCEVLECPRITTRVPIKGDGYAIADTEAVSTEIHAVVRKP